MLRTLGLTMRAWSRWFERTGVSIQGDLAHVERLVPSTRVVGYKGARPSLADSCFVSPNATVVGDVALGDRSSVWYGASIRADTAAVHIGSNTNVQDRASVVATSRPVAVGDNVSIGANATLLGCTVESEAVVGAGAQVCDGAVVKSHAMVAAGAMIPAGAVVGSREVWSGVPAVKVGEVTAVELSTMRGMVDEITALSEAHERECSKSFDQVHAEELEHEIESNRDPDFVPPPNDSMDAPSSRSGLLFDYKKE